METRTLRFAILLAALATSVSAADMSNLKLKAATDKENPIDYRVGENIRFDFRLDGVTELPEEAATNAPFHVIWTRTGDDGITVKGSNDVSLAQGFSINTSLAVPGIVRYQAYLRGANGKNLTYIGSDGKSANIMFEGGAGADTHKMFLSTVEPGDFDQFWAEAKAKLAAVPFEDDVELIEVFPNNSATNTHRFYAAKIPCLGPNPVTGWLTVPKKSGKFPAIAYFEGYSATLKTPTMPTSNSGDRIRLNVNAHGYDLVGHDRQYYDDFETEFLKPAGRKTYGLEPSDYDNPTNAYFYYMALRVVRAFDYLKSRPEWNGTSLIASGGSQGGLQTMWAGGLVDGITKIEPYITWGCDIGCPFNGSSNPYPSRTWGFPSVPGAYYFDSALHAKRVPLTCTAEITRLGMGDYTCPPRGVLMSYYNMKCPVSAKLVQGSTHGYTPPNPNQTFIISKGANSNVYQAPDAHIVTFRRLNGTVLSKVAVPHGGSLTPPAAPEEAGFTFKAWDHADWLANVTKDVTCWALYEKAGYPDSMTDINSSSIVARDEPYTLDEFFQMYDNVAWSDEFSESALKEGFYSSRGSRAAVDISAELSANRIVENGLLKLRVQREDSGKYHFTSGEITTSGKVTFLKGRIEIRAKLNYARGTWPSFWTMNSGWLSSYNEIDVFEQLSGSDWIGGTLHAGSGGSVTSSSHAAPEDGVRFRDGFHRIGAIVTDRELIWYVDDHIFKRMDITESAWSATPSTAKYLLLCSGLCAGGWLESLGTELRCASEADIPADFMVDDYEIDYLRIYTNTNADNTAVYDTPAPAARLSGPVSATVWRGYDMCYGKNGSDFTSNVNKGYETGYYINTALDHHFRNDKADIVALLSITDDPDGELKSAFDLPGKSAAFIDTKFKNDNGWKFQESRTGFIYDSDRFETASAGLAPIILSSDANFTNCYAVCADLKEKTTGARVKVVAVNVIATNGVDVAGSAVAQGFDTLFAKLNDMAGDDVILFLQGWSWGCWNYVRTRAATDLSSTFSRIGDNNAWPAYQSAYASKGYASASAARPAAFPVPVKNSSISYQHNPQALQATVAFDLQIAADDGLTDTFDAATYAKSMTISFPNYAGAQLSGFPVLVRLSTAISGFDYAGFQFPNGGDLRFTDSEGNLLPHEIDTWDPAGESTVWVKVPSLTYSTAITAHWGCSRPARVDPTEVWDGDYVGVWHLGQSALPLQESSGTSVDFTRSSGDSVAFAASGIVGGAVDFATASRTNAVVAMDNAALDGFAKGTVEVWTKQPSHIQNTGILSKRTSYISNISYFVYDNGSSSVLCLPKDGQGTNYVTCVSTSPAMGQWSHQAYTFDTTAASANTRAYLNGVGGTAATKEIAACAGAANLCLGAMQGGAAANFVGQIDEVRISKAVRSADWIKATHDTIADPSFARYEVTGAPPPDPGISLSGATAEPGFSWTNGTASVTISAADASAMPEDAKVRLRIVDASGAVLGTIDRTWTGAGEYTFDTSEAVSAASLANSYDYTVAFSVVDGEGTAIGSAGVAATTLRLGAEVPWFAANPTNGTVVGGAWDGNVAPAVVNGYFVMETNAVFAAIEGRTGLVHIEAVVPPDALVTESDLARQRAYAAADGSRAGLAPVVGDNGGIVWYGLVQEDGAPAWRALVSPESESAGGSPAPLLGAMEIDFTNTPVRVSYLAGTFDGESGAPPVLSRLHDASGAEWFPAPGSGTAADGRLDVRMGGRIGAFEGISYDKAVAEADGVRYDSLAEAIAAGDVTLLTNAEMPPDAPVGTMTITTDGHTLLQGGVSVEGQTVIVQSGVCAINDGGTHGTIRIAFNDLQNLGIATANRSPAQIANDLETIGANGIAKWESYVLGLDATDSTSQPKADITVDSEDALVSLTGVDVKDVGPTITYRVLEIPDLSSPNVATNVGPAVAPGTPVPLPMGDAAARFFRVKVMIDLH